jgi:hypothetical protein
VSVLDEGTIMELEMQIKGSLASLPGNPVAETAFLSELTRRGLSDEDAAQALQKALMEAWVARGSEGWLHKLPRALAEAVPGNLANT